ncbi:MAG: 50S ribosomal protein L23 [Candidatus Liptonbacteria bacterium GWC1_60_9]|uniref:Large ribosomal subunit protein uL23 n=3 Tax=Candidatus Liptoniibacteriota TaxID=1817909 RepID=A0A1G2CLK3_9BACT|nr:MAG: 50S ribosomal protein L23 [Parcubacteria group bacterium GW2011_GWA1_60_11]OGY97275.1 MAG: 50S ribosomal protein L23 [Candidatus Liptonbacteria bacterium GWC1_60_9]OGY98736.1 MAG: 50S ribosomal protein L23 [Candidatus Liptonbacteria bacterium RIFCSPHIGHO2_12_FULL_60_13]OGZ02276.1 MAG: 50S ribosomal protein L23 [Candidatus Liptonbacteria bacterium RIFCSPLOWO2_12_FULL_60_15]
MADLSLIIKPWVTEKANALSRMGKYVFMVKPEATKNEVRKALKKLYGVDAVKVDVVNARGRKRRFMRTFTPGRRYKKAIVTLKTGQTLDIIPK